MKRLFALAVLILTAGTLTADYAQKMPSFGEHRQLVRTLDGVTVVKVIETAKCRGVIATYERIYSGVGKDGATPAGRCEDNVNGQRIFITGLDHRIITDRCFLFHRYYSGRHLLFVRPLGVATVELDGQTLRLRKYTVDFSSDEGFSLK